MSKHLTALESIDRQLRLHHLRVSKLRAWRDAVVESLRRCEGDESSRRKAMDTTPSAETLEYERDTLDREIRAHEILMALGRDRQALELLEQVAGDPSLAREAAADPRAFAQARGVQLAHNMAVRVNIVADRVSIELDYIDRSCAASLTFP
jgi:hypothetical protein